VRRYVPLIALLLLALGLGACASEEPPPEQLWETSAHADTESAAFTNWDNRDPAEISTSCAKCHSTPGYRDFLGDDGSQPGQVDQPAAVGTTIECEACHNDAASAKTAVVMPSGASINGLGREANCMECHQGRASGFQIQDATDGLPLDALNSELSFINVHSSPVSPTQYGSQASGGYEYAGREYAEQYRHTPEFQSCAQCHNPTVWKSALTAAAPATWGPIQWQSLRISGSQTWITTGTAM